jgi:hypothetical protein
MLAQDGGSQQQIFRIIVEQQHTDRIFDQVQNLAFRFIGKLGLPMLSLK